MRFSSLESLGFSDAASVWSDSATQEPSSPKGRHLASPRDPETVADWRPEDFTKELNGSDVRWSVLVILMVVVAGLAVADTWLPSWPWLLAAAVLTPASALLGVDLVVIVALCGLMLIRRRWASRQPGAFRGAIRVVDGEVAGLGARWTRGYGRWVRDVLVWTRAPLLLRNELVAVDGPSVEVRAAEPGEVRRVGSEPVIAQLTADGGARVEVAAASIVCRRVPVGRSIRDTRG